MRVAMTLSRSADRPQALGKYWHDLLGQFRGYVRQPMLELTANEKATIIDAIDFCGLNR